MAVSVQEKPLEQVIASLISRHSLVRVEMKVTQRIIFATAIGAAHHPQVGKNRQALLETAAREAGGSVTLQEAQQIVNTVADRPIAEAYGDTFQEALKALSKELNALK